MYIYDKNGKNLKITVYFFYKNFNVIEFSFP